MTETKFKIMLQEYADRPVNLELVKDKYQCETCDKFKAYGLSNLWQRAVMHAISQNGEEWLRNAIVDEEPLCALFDWKQTEEGYIFWRKVYKRICCGELSEENSN